MNYLTRKNDRRRRRKAVALTALITAALLAAAAYSVGLLDGYLEGEPPATEIIADVPTA